MQPIIIDQQGIVRFKENKIVSYLLAQSDIDMNDLTRLEFIDEDREQFAQLIGYSVCGFFDLSYASEETIETAETAKHALIWECYYQGRGKFWMMNCC